LKWKSPAISKDLYSWEKAKPERSVPLYTRKIVWMPVAVLAIGAFAAWVAFGIFTSQYKARAEEFDLKQVTEMEAASVLYDREGREFGKIFIQNRQPVTYERLPQALVDAVISAEDNRFYSHTGVDYMGIFRAAITNYLQGRIAQGASTVTQQLARNSFGAGVFWKKCHRPHNRSVRHPGGTFKKPERPLTI